MKPFKINISKTPRHQDSLDKYLQDIAKEPMLSIDEEVELSDKIQKENSKEALDKLVKSNLRFVVSVAKHYQHQGLSLGDLIGYGNLGLIRAAKTFDHTKGFKFISYAVWWIQQSIMQALTDTSRMVRLPANQVASLNKMNKIQEEWFQQTERMPSNEEFAEIMELPEDKIKMYLAIPPEPTSIDAPFNTDSENTLIDVIENEDSPHADEHLMQESFDYELKELLKELSEREQYIIISFFGLFGSKVKSHDELAEELGLTRERIRQCKLDAIKKLQKSKNVDILRDYL